MRRAAVLLGAMTLLAGGCSQGPDTSVRPLVDLEGVALNVAKYDDASLQGRLERLVGEVAPFARKAGGWGSLTTDVLNPEISDIVFIGQERATLNFGYGTEATSMLARDDHAIFVAAGDSGTCWGIRIGGDFEEPEAVYGNVFAPNCSADQLGDHVLLPCSTEGGCPDAVIAEHSGRIWYPQWPAAALPTSTGPDGIEVGEPPAGGTGG